MTAPGWQISRYDVLHALASALAIAVLGWAAVALSEVNLGVALWWPAAGAAVAAVVSARPAARWWILVLVSVASGVGNLAAGRPLVLSILFGLSNAAEAAVAAWWLTRHGRTHPSLASLTDLGRLLGAALLGALVIAVGATAAVVLVEGGEAVPTFPHLLASHASATILIVPLVLWQPRTTAEAGRIEVMLQVVAAAGVVVLVFGPAGQVPLSFLVGLPLVWGALRFPLRIVTIEVTVVLAACILLTWLGHGPIVALQVARGLPQLTFTITQAFVASVYLVVLVLALAVNQRRDLLQQVAGSERLLRAGFNDSLVGTLILRGEGRSLAIVEVNEVASDLLGVSTSSTGWQRDWTSRLQGDPNAMLAGLRAVLAGRSDGWRGQWQISAANGEQRWLDVAASAMSTGGLLVLHLVDETARKVAEAALERLALYDPLTGLPNRVLLRDRLEHELARGARESTPLSLFYLDLDDFKRVNDAAGHPAGDAVLVAVAERLLGTARRSDTVSRLGGDEFVVVLPRTRLDDTDVAVQRILAALAEPVTTPGGTFRVSCSIGIVVSRPGSTVDELLRDADTAMYVSKGRGRAQATIFDEAYRERAVRDARIVAEFEDATERGELSLHLQPIWDLVSREIVAAEALVRWRHPQRGLLLPGEWLDVVIRGGGGPQLESWVVATACEILGHWWRLWGAQCPRLHVNVSTGLLQRGHVNEQVLAALEASGAPASKLVVELTETQLEGGPSSLVLELEGLRASGVGVSVDDFGTGYSAFSRLATLPIDELKIDRGLVIRMLVEHRSRAIVSSIVALASTLRLDVVAEGIDAPEQDEFLRDIGCGMGQGFLWSAAVPVDELTSTLARRLGSGTEDVAHGPSHVG